MPIGEKGNGIANQGINIYVLSDFKMMLDEYGLVGVEGDVHGGY